MSEEMNAVKVEVVATPEAKEITLNFNRLTGYALIKCEKAAKKEDSSISLPVLSLVYQSYVAAAAAGVMVDDIYALPGDKFTKVCQDVQNFLLNSDK